jgi:hypothetical protein
MCDVSEAVLLFTGHVPMVWTVMRLCMLPVSAKTGNHIDLPAAEGTLVLIHTLVAGTSSKEHLGQSTWTFLHTLAAQYPEQPTRAQKRDTVQLVCIFEVSCGFITSRMHQFTEKASSAFANCTRICR